MVGIGKGVFEATGESGKKYGFRFGNYASAITQQIAKKKITEVIQSMFGSDEESLIMILYYFYGAAVWYAKLNNQPVPNDAQVSDWLEDIGLDETTRIYQESLQVPNVETPANHQETPGQQSTTV